MFIVVKSSQSASIAEFPGVDFSYLQFVSILLYTYTLILLR